MGTSQLNGMEPAHTPFTAASIRRLKCSSKKRRRIRRTNGSVFLIFCPNSVFWFFSRWLYAASGLCRRLHASFDILLAEFPEQQITWHVGVSGKLLGSVFCRKVTTFFCRPCRSHTVGRMFFLPKTGAQSNNGLLEEKSEDVDPSQPGITIIIWRLVTFSRTNSERTCWLSASPLIG